MAKFVPFSVTDAREMFETQMGFVEVFSEGTWERIWQMPVKESGYAIRIFSSVSVETGYTRDKGEDAIRVTLWDIAKDRPVKVERRVNRVGTGALGRARERARELWQYVTNKANYCPHDGALLVERSSRGKHFKGCSNYPHCRHTAPM